MYKRQAFIAHCAPYVRDVVIAGADRDFIGVLVFPDLDACRELTELPKTAGAADIVAHEKVRAAFAEKLGSMARASTGSSNRILRAILMDMPPSLDVGEATDKGSINQRMVLKARATLVNDLYANTPPAHVITVDGR